MSGGSELTNGLFRLAGDGAIQVQIELGVIVTAFVEWCVIAAAAGSPGQDHVAGLQIAGCQVSRVVGFVY